LASARERSPARESRSEAKNAAARAALVPLEPGERPGAVTVAAVAATALAVGNVLWFVIGVGDDARPPPEQGLPYSVLMGLLAWGLWRGRYWAALTTQALLTLAIILFFFFLLRASNGVDALIALGVIVPSGVLFWFLVGAMARMQMPDEEEP
jgi:hypothetical protein